MNVPRRHHYVPKSYLAAWTTDGTANGQLQVIDKSNGRMWVTRPANAAVETDLYMINEAEVVDDIEATHIEEAFGLIEGAAAPLIRAINCGGGVPEGDNLEHLMAFIAVLKSRVPKRLRWIDDVMRKPVEVLLQTMHEDDDPLAQGDPELAAKMKEWFEAGLITIKIKQNPRLAMMISMLPTLVDLLKQRHWTVLRAAQGSGELVCTDNPVLLEWTKAAPQGYSPGFGLKHTAVFMPISPVVALLGLWDAEPTNTQLSQEQVAVWNGELIGFADRFVFSRENFLAKHRSGTADDRVAVAGRFATSE